MKRFAAIIFALCLLLSAMPTASASPLPFSDVTMGDWFFEEVAYVYNGGMMSGTSATTFSPNGTTTRGMIVTILHRMAGQPQGSGSFEDVNASAYYAAAVSWASDQGIVSGYGNGRFGPNDPITREQLAAILYRYAAHQGRNTEISGDLSGFADCTEVSSYAEKAMCWAVGEGLISGMGSSGLVPGGTATRAQVAVILTRFCNNAPEKPAEPTPETPQEQPDKVETQTSAEDTLVVDGMEYYLGMDASQLPEAVEYLPSVYGFTWYVFGTDDYDGFFAAGVSGGMVMALTASGNGFSHMGYSCGDAANDLPKSLATDSNDGDVIHGVLILEDGIWEAKVTAQTLAGESKLNFHLTNGFRVCHGMQPLRWCDTAAEAARLHSEDMAQKNYFNHDSLDGSKFYERMQRQGLSFSYSGENIAASTIGMAAFEAYDGWVNSSGHRKVMLDDYDAMGVGAAFCADSTWACCYTQDFYR